LHDDCRERDIPEDRRFSRCGFAEKMLFWSVRTWVQRLKREEAAEPLLAEAYGRLGMADAALTFDAAMSLLTASARRPIDVRCPSCPELSDDERLLARALAAAQRGDEAGLWRLLAELMQPPGVRVGARQFQRLAQRFREARLVLPEAQAGAMEVRASHAMAAGEASTLH